MLNLIFDTETTGLVKHPDSKREVQPRIIEWAGALVDENGELVESKVQLINPGQEISEEITKITGITNDMLADQPRIEDVIVDILQFMRRADQLIAHNLPFDLSLMEFECIWTNQKMPQYASLLCTVQEHEAIFGYRPTLIKLYEYYFDKPLQQTHRALDDVMALVEICREAGVLL